jgi:hypothetical protein
MTSRHTIAAILTTTAVAFSIASPARAAELAREASERVCAENRDPARRGQGAQAVPPTVRPSMRNVG